MAIDRISGLDREKDMATRETTARQISTAGESTAEGATVVGATAEGITAEGVTAEGVTAEGVTAEGAAEEASVACSLSPAGLAAQAGRWTRLADRAMTERTKTAHGLRIGFRPEPGAEQELRELVAVETECCPWATWTVETSAAGQVVLDVRSTGQGIAALHDMFTSLRPSRPC